MLIVTARIPRRRLMAGGISALCCCLVLVAALALSLHQGAVPTTATLSQMNDNHNRVAYLEQMGWTVGENAISTQELLIPETLDESYNSYLTLLHQQGFALEDFCGKHIQRYVYQITNHPSGQGNVQAVLLVYDDTLVGGHVQAQDGSFVSVLEYPHASAAPSPAPIPSPSTEA